MSKKVKGAAVAQSVGAAIAAGDLTAANAAASAVLPKLEEYAEREAGIIDKATAERRVIWVEVISGYAHDFPELSKYPQKVRHAYARKLGLNMSTKRANWEPAQRKLYDSFCANQVSPLALMIELVGNKGAGVALELLKGAGKLPEKVQQAKLMLGRPVKTRTAKQQNAADKKGDGEAQTSVAAVTQRAEEMKKPVVEIVASIISGVIPTAQLPKVVQACAAKLKGSADPLDRLLSEWLERDLTEYAKKADSDDDDGKLAVNE